jgi:hypothetical protein
LVVDEGYSLLVVSVASGRILVARAASVFGLVRADPTMSILD